MRRLIGSPAALRAAARATGTKRTIAPAPTALLQKHLGVSDEVRWSAVINKAAKAVVALRTSNVRTFDSALSSCSQATGFVVDRELGLILTNRHVVLVGPVTAEAVFENHEGVPCKPIYRDPIHDFGFLKYDPKSVQYMDVGEIELFPQGAKVGTEIRIIGNDAGEKIMVLRGTISRLDRAAPYYGPMGYNDHDTFYITSASGTSGGSSGSPVIDFKGRCVALNAGGSTQASTSFFLPLDRIPRALEYVRSIIKRQEDTIVVPPLPRGTLHTIFKHQSLDEVRRLGLPAHEESAIRKAEPLTTGMLTIGRVLPESVGQRAGFREGDIVLRIDGDFVTGFVTLEQMLDDAAGEGRELTVELQRGKETLKVNVKPESLWDVLPDEYIEYSRGIYHPLSINLAINTTLPSKGIFMAQSGYSMANIQGGTLIREIGSNKINSLDDFENAICQYPDGATVRVRYSHLSAPNTDHTAVITIDRKWFPMVRRKRHLNKDGEKWSYRECSPAPALTPKVEPVAQNQTEVVRRPQLSGIDETVSRVLKSLVTLYSRVPFEIDGQQGSNYFGAGFVVDKKRGIIACDRNTVTCLPVDAKISIEASVELPAKPIYLHPTSNFCFLQVDPIALSSKCDVEDVRLFDDPKSLEVKNGDELMFFGITEQKQVKIIPSLTVTSIERANVRTPSTPRFAAKNFDVATFDQVIGGTIGGILVDAQGVARSMWTSFHVQERNENTEIFSTTLVGPMREALKDVQSALDSGVEVPPVYQLGVELGRVDFAEARSGYGLSDEMVRYLSDAADAERTGGFRGTREVFIIERTMAISKALNDLQTGDILLTCPSTPLVNDVDSDLQMVPILSYNVLDQASKAYASAGKKLPLTILREGQIMNVEVELTPLSPLGTKRVLFFAGLQVQPTHDAVFYHGFSPANLTNEKRGCFISGVAFGSPASSAGVYAVRWIVEVDDVEVDSLDSLIKELARFKKSGECVRLRLQDLQGAYQVVTVRLDLDFWQTSLLEYDEETKGWHYHA